jgi:phosphoserine phosphatase
MYVATLIANPEIKNLNAAIASEAMTALGGTEFSWLAGGIAADVPLVNMPDDLEKIWENLQSKQIDLVVQLSAGRRKKVLLADMDSTMIQQECIDELAAAAGVGERVVEITARAMNGDLDFDAALNERVGLLAGLDVDVIQQVLDTRITLMPGGAELLATMRANGAYAALVSGGFTDFTSAIATQLGFDENRANTLLQSNGKLTGHVGMPILGRQAKVDALLDITERLGLLPADVIAVGDGANDLGMLHLAGSGVALHAKPLVAAECSLRLNFADLTGLLFIQGYNEAEFKHGK